ncbi:MAG: LysR family transcriptional regulator [Pseudomonadales bacterium]|nr:LysR family transcriptional regulator [Pseudomonadales bacterium]MCP5357977.1 LysR family transcriptional regulator [Pseudomonadales bacterium]
MKTPRISLEQWASFKAVVDEGSFALAAEALNKSQSSISYAIARLNEQLPRPVLTLEGRKAVMTEEGKVLYRRAACLLQQAEETEDVAQQLAQGLEAEVTLALDNLIDIRRIIPSLSRLSEQYPLTRIRVLETALSGTEEALLERKADLAIGPTVPVGFSGEPVRQIRMIPVAHPEHPLFQTTRPQDPRHLSSPTKGVSEWEMRLHRQVVLADSGQRRTRDSGWLGSEQRWTVNHFSSSLKVLRAGLAFGFLPEDWVEDDLRSGGLRRLPVGGDSDRLIQLYLIRPAAETLGPATSLLAATLRECLSRAAPAQLP